MGSPCLYDLDSALEKLDSLKEDLVYGSNPNLNNSAVISSSPTSSLDRGLAPVRASPAVIGNALPQQQDYAELALFNLNDIRLDLQSADYDGILAEIARSGQSAESGVLQQQHNQQVQAQSQYMHVQQLPYSVQQQPVKQEPRELDEYNPPGYPGSGYPNYPGYGQYQPSTSLGVPAPRSSPGSVKSVGSPASSVSSYKRSKDVDKSSDEYRRRRERNNIAVRRSREKAKLRSIETERKVQELHRENSLLNRRVHFLTEEINCLRKYLDEGLPEPFKRQVQLQLEAIEKRYQQ